MELNFYFTSPATSSYTKHPRAHQSALFPWPLRITISGAFFFLEDEETNRATTKKIIEFKILFANLYTKIEKNEEFFFLITHVV